jgi:hypothetical protein
VAVAVGAALVGASGVRDAAAKKKKSSVSATIDGKHRTWGARKITVDVTAGLVTFVATIKRPHRLNQLIPGLSMGCQLDLAGPFPVTPVCPQPCVLGYSEVRFSRHPDPKMWGGSNCLDGIEVTFDAFDAGRLTGRFHGTLTSQNTPANPPVTVGGTFSINIGG